MGNIFMKTIIVICVCFIIGVCVAASVSAQQSFSSIGIPTPTIIDYTLPYPGILPDHPLYFLKNIRDEILLFFTKDPLKNSRIRLLLSDKQIGMTQQFIERGLYVQATQILQKGEKQLLIAVLQLDELKKRGELPAGSIDKFELAAKKHEYVITSFLQNDLPENIKISLKETLGITHQTIENASGLK